MGETVGHTDTVMPLGCIYIQVTITCVCVQHLKAYLQDNNGKLFELVTADV